MPTKKKYSKVKGKKDTYTKKKSAWQSLGIARFASAVTGGPKQLKVDGYTGASKKKPKKK